MTLPTWLEPVRDYVLENPERSIWIGVTALLALATLYFSNRTSAWRIECARLRAGAPVQVTHTTIPKEAQILQEYNQGLKRILDSRSEGIDNLDEFLRRRQSGGNRTTTRAST